VDAIADRPAVDKLYVLADKAIGHERELTGNSKIEVLRLWKPDSPVSIVFLLWHLLRLKPDITHFNVHFQSYGKTRLANFAGFLLVPLSKIFGLKTLVLLHNLADKVDLQKVRLKPSFVNKAGILVATKLVITASSVVVTVESYVQYLKTRYGRDGVQYIPHGTSKPLRMSTNHKGAVLLFFGHIGPSKGLPTMFTAYEKLLKEVEDAKLVVAGDSHPNFPNYLLEMKKVAPMQVDFAGYVQEEDIAKMFNIADVVVLPYSAATGTSGVFHIACSYGKPIVATYLPEIEELVDKGACALLVPPGDHEALKDAILKIISNKSLAAKMSEQNLVFARKQEWPAIAEAYENEYLRLLHIIHSDKGKNCVSVIAPSCETSHLKEFK
jgi:glycosyltransferase involved in cell wall biosynthesis